ncbi:MAG: 50S ribosomal protein L37ae [Candidatus Aenigmatarchaeota archaeon]
MVSIKLGSAGRWGARYGTRTKKVVAVMEREQNKPQACIRCERPAARRVAAGVWTCRKCGLKWAGGAYFPRSVVAAEIINKAKTAEKEKVVA